MQYVTISQARDELATLVESAEGVIITRNGVPVSVLANFETYRSMTRTLSHLSDSANMARILASHVKVQGGEFGDFIPAEEAIKKIEEAEEVAS